MVEFIVGAFLYARFKKKYSLKPIFSNWTIYLPLLCMIFYIFLEITVWMRWYWFIPYQQTIKTVTLLSYLPLILKYKLYESVSEKLQSINDFIAFITSPMVIGTVCIIVGTMLNLMAIKANNGMPIFPSLTIETGYLTRDLINDGLHVLGGFDTRLIHLTDIFDIGYSIMSIGDILVRMYAFLIIYYSIKRSNIILK